MNTIKYRLFDLQTAKFILADNSNPSSALEESVENSLLGAILPPEAWDKLSLATIEDGMDGDTIDKSHPEAGDNQLLLSRGDRGLYGPSEYKELISLYLDTVKDYAYHRYLSNANEKLIETEIDVWVIDDEEFVSGIDSVDSDIASAILGDSHGKISLDLAKKLIPEVEVDGELVKNGSTARLTQYRMLGVGNTKFFSKGTVAAQLNTTLKLNGLESNPDLKGIDAIIPTSSIKGSTKSNLPPGRHKVKVLLANHKQSKHTNYTLRAVTQKLEGDGFSFALKQQTQQIQHLNQSFNDSEKTFADFIKYIEPKNNRDGTPFNPERWRECGDWQYIAAREDYEAGHYQLLTSNVFSSMMNQFYASKARKAAELEFVKAKGGMIFCSHQLKNNEICVPYLKDGDRIAAVRSPIISLADISLVKNRYISEMYNDAGEPIEGAIICSPQLYSQYTNQTKKFIENKTEFLKNLEGQKRENSIDLSYLNSLNPFNNDRYRDAELGQIKDEEKADLVRRINLWRTEYNSIVNSNQLKAENLDLIRLDTFTSILAADFDGDNIAALSQSVFPEIYAGIARHIENGDNITEKLEKIKVKGQESLGEILARKADPFVIGKTANLAEQLQLLAVEAQRIIDRGNVEDKNAYLKKITPAFYHMLRDRSADKKIEPNVRDYKISSTNAPIVSQSVVQSFDAFGLDKELPALLEGKQFQESTCDRSIKLWQELLLDINLKIAQQNQIAVDTFKSERQVDNAAISLVRSQIDYLDDGLKQALYNRNTYFDKSPQVKDTSTNRGLLVENVNANLVPFGIAPSKYAQIKGLFPSVGDINIKTKVASQISQYNRYISMARRYRQKQKIDIGPSMVFNNRNRPIEISNINRCKLGLKQIQQLVEQKDFQVRIIPNRNKEQEHFFKAEYKSSNSNWQELGTLCNASAANCNIKEAQSFGAVEKINFVTPYGDSHAQSLRAKANQLCEDFANSIEPDVIDTYVAAAYDNLTNTNSKYNNLGFMFKTFGKQMAEAVSSFQLTNSVLNGIDPDLKLPADNRGKVLFDRDDSDSSKRGVYLLDEKDEISAKLGYINDSYFAPRLGATAFADIELVAPSVARVELSNGNSFSFGGMNKAELGGTIFEGEKIELEIATSQPKQIPLLFLDGKPLGRISSDTEKLLHQQGSFKNGQKLDVTLDSSGKGYGKTFTAVTNDGIALKLVDILQYADYSLQEASFASRKAVVSIGFKKQLPQLTVYAVKDGKRHSLGNFNRRYNKDKSLVKSWGLIGKPFVAKLFSKKSAININIDKTTLQYPKVARNLFDHISAEEKGSFSKENNPTTRKFLETAHCYSSIVHFQPRTFIDESAKQKNSLDAIDLIVDANYLTSKQTELIKQQGFNQISPDDPTIELETKKGFTVYSIPASHLSQAELVQLKRELAVSRVFDEKLAPRRAKADLSVFLNDNFSDIEPVDKELFTDMELPVFSQKETAGDSAVIASAFLIEFIKTRELLDKPSAVNLATKLDRYDYQWLEESGIKIKSVEDLLSLPPQALALAKEKLSGFLNNDGVSIYQNMLKFPDKMPEKIERALQGKMGQKRYRVFLDEAQKIIDAKIEPFTVLANGTVETVDRLTKNTQKSIEVPQPKYLKLGLKPAVDLGDSKDSLAFALGNPQDSKNCDIQHPISFGGDSYPSIQQAFAKLAPTIALDKTWALTKDLMKAKLSQHPKLIEQIQQRGGEDWLKQNRYFDPKNDFLSGVSFDSGLVRAWIDSYKAVVANKAIAATATATGSKNIKVKPKPRIHPQKANPIESKPVQISQGICISPLSKTPLGAALSNETQYAKDNGMLQQDYPISFRGNPYRGINTELSLEQYHVAKPEGQPFVSARDAYQHFQVGLNKAQKFDLIVEILEAKLTQHPLLAQAIDNRGGKEFLESAAVKSSGFKKALTLAYEKVRSPITKIAFANIQLQKDDPCQELKQLFSDNLHKSNIEGRVDDAVRILRKNGIETPTKSLFVSFANSEDKEALALNVAKMAQHTEAPRVSYFVEADLSGAGDVMMHRLSLNTDVAEARATAEMMGVPQYFLLPNESSTTDLIIPDLGNRQSQPIEYIKEHYGSALKTYSGSIVTLDRQQINDLIYDNQNQTQNPFESIVRDIDPILVELGNQSTKLVAFNSGNSNFIDRAVEVWGDRANSDKYSNKDTVLVIGSSMKEAGVMTIKKSFENNYKPLLDKLIAAKSSVIVRNNPGLDLLVQQYLLKHNYLLNEGDRGYLVASSPSLEAIAKSKPALTKAARDAVEPLILSSIVSEKTQAAKLIGKILKANKSTKFENESYTIEFNRQRSRLTLIDKSDNSLPLDATYSPEKGFAFARSSTPLQPKAIDSLRRILNSFETKSEKKTSSQTISKQKQGQKSKSKDIER